MYSRQYKDKLGYENEKKIGLPWQKNLWYTKWNFSYTPNTYIYNRWKNQFSVIRKLISNVSNNGKFIGTARFSRNVWVWWHACHNLNVTKEIFIFDLDTYLRVAPALHCICKFGKRANSRLPDGIFNTETSNFSCKYITWECIHFFGVS